MTLGIFVPFLGEAATHVSYGMWPEKEAMSDSYTGLVWKTYGTQHDYLVSEYRKL